MVVDAEKDQEMQNQIEFMNKIVSDLEDYKENRVFEKSAVFGEMDKIIATAEKK